MTSALPWPLVLATWIACVAMLGTGTAHAHAPLGPGDVAIVGVRQGSPDVLVVLALVQLHDGDTIELTDDGMRNDGTLRRAEGATFFEVVRTIVPAGTVLEVPAGTMSLDRSADQVFVYRGSIDSSGVLTGAWVWALGWGEAFGSDSTSARDSALPWPLAAQFTELPSGGADMAYVGITSGTANGLRAAIGEASNWRIGPAGSLAFPGAFDVRIDLGGACGTDADCGVGTFCVEGTCCDTTCGRGAIGHCLGCYFGIADPHNGTCGPAATTQLCRIGHGACDPQETCDGVSTTCPADALASAGTVCRAPRGPCDASEVCDGSTSLCPSDGLEPVGHVCRAPRDTCDYAESCIGGTTSCPPDLGLGDGTACTSRCGDAVCFMGVCGACPEADAGPVDASVESDAGVESDAATLVPDAGPPDATVVRDASARDSGPDAGASPLDAAREDAALADAADAGGRAADAGANAPAPSSCACRSASGGSTPGPSLVALISAWLIGRARRSRRVPHSPTPLAAVARRCDAGSEHGRLGVRSH